jgi:hypothetical protein
MRRVVEYNPATSWDGSSGADVNSGYSPEDDLESIESELAFLLYALGITDWSSFDELVIDDIINQAKSIYRTLSTEKNILAASSWTNNRHNHIVRPLRKLWWQRNIVRTIIANG